MDILAVIVLYKRILGDSPTVECMASEFRRNPGLENQIGVLIWDNGPATLDHPQIPFPALYRTEGRNIGVSGAYDRGLDLATSSGADWLLLLDQDTSIPRGALQHMLENSREMKARSEIAAVVPVLMSGNQISSPYIQGWFRQKLIHPQFRGTPPGLLMAHNSGTMVRIAALREIGGFNLDFWLDYSDIVLFDRLQRSGKRIFVAGDLQLQHSISISDYDSQVSPERYTNLLHAEASYWDLYRPLPLRALHTVRLLVRGIRQYFRLKNKRFAAMTLSHLWRRLRTRRSERLRQWKQASAERNIPLADEPGMAEQRG